MVIFREFFKTHSDQIYVANAVSKPVPIIGFVSCASLD